MSVGRSFGSAIGVAAFAALLAACGAGSQSSGLTPTMSQEAAGVQHVPGFGASKASEGGARFFVSDSGGNIVTF
jgi:hypothetical protein